MLQVQSLSLMKRQLKLFTSFVLAILISAMSVLPVFAATPKITRDTTSTLKYKLKGLKYNAAVQKAYISSKYVYVTQRVKDTCYLSRLLIDGNNATYVDKMTVTNAGHCQTLDMYSYNGKNYFYFSSKAVKDDSTSNYWSLQVARLQYKPGKKYNYTELNRFTYMNYANKDGKKLGTTKRVDGGGNSTYTIFRVETKEKTVTWSIYDTAKLNRLLDSKKQVRMDSEEAKEACILSFTQSESGIVRPNGSFQGVDMLDDNIEIYTSGGLKNQIPQIAMMRYQYIKSYEGLSYESLVKITNFGHREIEGVQLKDGNVYFTIVIDDKNKKDSQEIHYVPESIFF